MVQGAPMNSWSPELFALLFLLVWCVALFAASLTGVIFEMIADWWSDYVDRP